MKPYADLTWYTLWRLSTFQDNGLCMLQTPGLTRTIQFAPRLYTRNSLLVKNFYMAISFVLESFHETSMVSVAYELH